MSFVTKLDYSNNRQIKQFILTDTQLSGTTTFGVTDNLIPENVSGDTINIDALQYIRARGIILPNSLPLFTGVTSQILGRDTASGKIVEIELSGVTVSGITGDDYVTSGIFSATTGNLNLTRVSGGTVSVNLDGRYLNSSGYTAPTGLQAINEGNGIGWRLIGRNAATFGNIGANAVDFGFNYSANSTKGAVGSFSFNHGEDNRLAGFGSVGFGALITSTAIDDFNAGINLTNAGYSNSLFGTGHSVQGMNITVVGQAANIISNQFADYNNSPELKQMFVVGNGTVANSNPNFTVLTRSDAFIVRMNGVITAPSLTTALIDSESSGRVLITKEYLKKEKNIGGNYTLTASDENSKIFFTGTSATTITVTVNNLTPTSFDCEFYNISGGTVTFTGGTANLFTPGGAELTAGIFGRLFKRGSNNEFHFLRLT